MEKQEAIKELKTWLKPGDTLYTDVTHVSKSGMTRWIRVFLMEDNRPIDISYTVAKAIERNVNNRNHAGIECGGCGMDMGFEVVYALSYRLWPDGFECVGDGCPSNEHNNNPRGNYVGKVHTSGGYALRQCWL